LGVILKPNGAVHKVSNAGVGYSPIFS